MILKAEALIIRHILDNTPKEILKILMQKEFHAALMKKRAEFYKEWGDKILNEDSIIKESPQGLLSNIPIKTKTSKD